MSASPEADFLALVAIPGNSSTNTNRNTPPPRYTGPSGPGCHQESDLGSYPDMTGITRVPGAA
eukprot:512260-Rhodomonas_salina.2